MPSNSIQDNALKVPFSATALHTLARKKVFALLSRLTTGRLTLREGVELYEFGETCNAGGLSAHIEVEDVRVYSQIALKGSTGAGEAYVRKHWHSPDLVNVVRLFVANMHTLEEFDSGQSWWNRLLIKARHMLHKNTLHGSRKNIGAHYDLSNEFFALFLDESMMYSAAIFPRQDSSLEEAAEYKLKHICERLQLTADDHLLEIGTGWGSLAIYAARQYGCRVTTTTISAAQFSHATRRVNRLGLQDRITVLQQDYRKLAGSFDKLVSIEMIEAVGHQYYQDYFRQCSQLLKPDGLMLLQSITIPDQRYKQARSDVDFIKKYIFPGGCLPSISVIAQQVASHTDMQLVGLEDITQHYERTLNVWHQRFRLSLDKVRQQGFDDTFIRMWSFYLAYCEGGFAERVIGTAQLLLAKPGFRRLPALPIKS